MPTFYVRRDGERKPQRSFEDRSIYLYLPRWIDPYWFINGSVPEKMVMTELVRRGIYFEHVPQTQKVGGFVPTTWEPDFLFPQYKIWLEVNGLYFHTLPGAIEADALRYAKIEASGWRVIVWWDYDIISRLTSLMDSVPEFYMVNPAKQKGPTNFGLPFYEGGTGIDHLKGLRTALRRRARPPQLTYQYRLPGERVPL